MTRALTITAFTVATLTVLTAATAAVLVCGVDWRGAR